LQNSWYIFTIIDIPNFITNFLRVKKSYKYLSFF